MTCDFFPVYFPTEVLLEISTSGMVAESKFRLVGNHFFDFPCSGQKCNGKNEIFAYYKY